MASLDANTRSSTLPNVLVIVINQMAMEMPLDLWPALKQKALVTFVTTEDEALAQIKRGILHAVLLADPAIADEHPSLRKEVTRYAEGGGRVIMCCLFASFISQPTFDKYLDDEWGQQWKFGCYGRRHQDCSLNPARLNVCPHPLLPNCYSMKAVSLESVDMGDIIYIRPDNAQAAVAYTKFGEGWLGYVGDVNAEKESTIVVLAMAELLSSPEAQFEINPKPSLPPRLIDSPVSKNPRLDIKIINLPYPSIPPSVADRNRRFQPYPPNATPFDLFTVSLNTCDVPGSRFIHTGSRFIRKHDRKQMLMFCGGPCSGNGQANNEPRGGYGVVITYSRESNPISLPLENDGIKHDSNHAELRSVISGLGLRAWYEEGFESVVVAMDSEYVVLGVTERLNKWIERGWKTAARKPVANQDLWQMLLKRLRELEAKNCHVQFWQIPKEWNEADEYAKKGMLVKSDQLQA